MLKKIFLLIFLIPSALFAQTINNKLQKSVEALVKNYNGEIGIYIKSLKTGKVAQINADTVFPTASIVKVPILIGIINKIKLGELAFHQEFVYSDSMLYAGVDILGSFKNGEKIELSKLIMLMLSMSDNTASLWLQKLAGTGTEINKLMEKNGFTNTRVNSKTIGREIDRAQYGWGQTTAKEMATVFEKLYRGEIISDSLSKKMIRLLGRNYWDEEALSEIPSTIFVASKSGAVDASRSEILLVMAKEPYLLSVFTKNNKDKSWDYKNEAWVLTRKLSKMAYEFYSR
jgi:beta-lactamase class A